MHWMMVERKSVRIEYIFWKKKERKNAKKMKKINRIFHYLSVCILDSPILLIVLFSFFSYSALVHLFLSRWMGDLILQQNTDFRALLLCSFFTLFLSVMFLFWSNKRITALLNVSEVKYNSQQFNASSACFSFIVVDVGFCFF